MGKVRFITGAKGKRYAWDCQQVMYKHTYIFLSPSSSKRFSWAERAGGSLKRNHNIQYIIIHYIIIHIRYEHIYLCAYTYIHVSPIQVLCTTYTYIYDICHGLTKQFHSFTTLVHHILRQLPCMCTFNAQSSVTVPGKQTQKSWATRFPNEEKHVQLF